MKIFVSFSFRPENDFVEKRIIPLIRCFGHEPVTGRILDSGPLDGEVKKKILQCRRVLCFATRAQERYDREGKIVSYEPPDWVRDELMMARGAGREAIEFRESGVDYEGAAPLRPYVEFERTEIADLLVKIAERISKWPVGPLQLRLTVPEEFSAQVKAAANAARLTARCSAVDWTGTETRTEELRVHLQDERLIVPFWINPDPNITIGIEIDVGARCLACRGISPTVRVASLEAV
jgi:hypothetical protein